MKEEVIFDQPNNGYKHEQEFAKKHLVVGNRYIIENKVVHKFHTDYYFEGYPNLRFTSVLFTHTRTAMGVEELSENDLLAMCEASYYQPVLYNAAIDEIEFCSKDTNVVSQYVNRWFSVLKDSKGEVVGFTMLSPLEYAKQLEILRGNETMTDNKKNFTVKDQQDTNVKPTSAPPAGKVQSTSDERTVNNVMRHEYKVLSDDEKMYMQQIKDMGLELHSFIEALQPNEGSRELSIAQSKVEEAVMWAVKHITK